MKNKFELLKDISIEMRSLAFDEIEKEFPDDTGKEKELMVYSLFNHGVCSQRDLLKDIYNVDIKSLDIVVEALKRNKTKTSETQERK